jgi:protein-S-isoprenylcysteine O-methyltransferase Ste14
VVAAGRRGTTLALVSLGFVAFGGPGLLAGLVPWVISRWRFRQPFFGFGPLRAVGVVLVALGLAVLGESIIRFVRVGRGTLVPAVPTEQLVVSGLYRYVRNPMYVAVTTMIVGEGLLFGDARMLVYASVVAVGFHLFVRGYEEPTLRRTYGAEFDRYCGAVRRWLPHLRAAQAPFGKGAQESPSSARVRSRPR